MGRWVGIATAVASVLVTAASAGPATTGGTIVFSAVPEDSMVAQLFAIHPSGDGLKQITTGANPAVAPAFSPNGKRVAFVRFGFGVFTMNPNGSGIRRVTTNPRDSYPGWSPDGKRIVFVRPIGPKWRPYIVTATGGKPRPLSAAPPAGRPSWTRAGLLIPSGGDLLRIDTAKGHVVKYYGANIDTIWGLNSVVLSPKATLLTFVGARDSESGDKECGEGACQRFGLFLENLTFTKKKPRLIVKDTGPAAFSPDGKDLVFVAGGGLVLRPVGSGLATRISTGGATPTLTAPPSWR